MKKRPESHVIDSAGEQLLRQALPAEWVVRDYRPDYGIDLAVEVFDSAGDKTVAVGDHFFVQLKSHASVSWITKKVHPRLNVEKGPLVLDRSKSADLRVISENIDQAELSLARSMGSAVPLVLAVVDVERAGVYWVCLNDFVDKILIPEKEILTNQDSHTVYVPQFNRIDRTPENVAPLRLLARRAKLYGAFNRFRYQRNELARTADLYRSKLEDGLTDDSIWNLAGHFLEIILAYDFWTTTPAWPGLENLYENALKSAEIIRRMKAGESVETILGDEILREERHRPMCEFLLLSRIEMTFQRLETLGNIYEEICREWCLPTYLGWLVDRAARGLPPPTDEVSQ